MLRKLIFFIVISTRDAQIPKDVKLIIALPGESQAIACLRAGLKPINLANFRWNSSSIASAIYSIGNNLTSILPIVSGCCEPGLWCTDKGRCFTNSLGSTFSNYGWQPDLFEERGSPVYSCITGAEAFFSNKLSVLSNDNGILRLSGGTFSDNYIGNSRDNFQISVFGENCANVDSCNKICKPCSEELLCPLDSVCLYSSRTSRTCFMFCAGIHDTSCPCDSACARVDVSFDTISGPDYKSVHLCTPKSFSAGGSSSVCHDFNVALQCELPYTTTSTVNKLQDAKFPLNITVTSLVSGKISGTKHINGILFHQKQCATNNDCYDGNICTREICNKTLGTCEYMEIDGCQSMSTSVRDEQAPFTYMLRRISNNQDLHTIFEKSVITKGTKSPISGYDDFPLDSIKLHFSFNYFGNVITHMSLSPNGILQLPPVAHCNGNFASVEVSINIKYVIFIYIMKFYQLHILIEKKKLLSFFCI